MCTYFFFLGSEFLGKKLFYSHVPEKARYIDLSKNTTDHFSAVTKAFGYILVKLAYLYYYFDTVHLTEA